MKNFPLLFLVPALLLCIVSGANAAVKAQGVSVSPYGGGYTFLDGQGLDTSATMGVRAGYNFTPHWSIEGVTDYTNTDGNVTHGADVHVYNWHLDMLYNFMPERKLVPYLVGGYGWQNRKYPGDNSTTRTGFNYGFGAKYFVIDDFLAVRGDFRHLVMKHGGDTFSDIQYTVGVDFVFGGKKQAAAAATAPAAAPAAKPGPP